MMLKTLPVTVVTGFLGAGKTTLVNEWLQRVPRGDVAVIVNEQGDVGIDGELLAQRVRLLIEVNGGCFCCTTQAELVQALDAIATSETRPGRVLIETSGAASPAGVLRAVVAGGRSRTLVLDGVITVLNATCVDAVLEHDVAREQLGYADVVVLSHADTCAPEQMAAAKSNLGLQNGAAIYVESEHGHVVAPAVRFLEEVLALRPMGFVALSPLPVQPSEHIYESVSLVLEVDVDGERFADFVETEVAEFAGRIFRIKGILAVAGLDVRMIVQGVADAIDITFGRPWGDAPRTSRLVVVGFGLEREALSRGFSSCAAR